MDRASCWSRRSVLILSVWLAGCASSSPDNQTKTSEAGEIVGCTGPDCGAVAGALLLMKVMTSPSVGGSGAGVHSKSANSIYGRCELLIGEDIKPCNGVVLTLKSPGYSRKAWVSEFDFEVFGVKGTKVDIEAYNDDYKVSTKLSNVKVGSQIRVQLKVPTK